MATQDAHKELFLDMLTKEEKEALLTKKMEDLRKQNQAIQKRYEEVQADKKRAEVKTGNKLPAQKKTLVAPKTTPQIEDHDPPQRQRQLQQQQMLQQQMHQQQMHQQQMQQQQMQQQQMQHLQQSSRPATRNRPQLSQGGGRGPKERPKSQDFRSEPAFEYEPIVDMADLDNRHAKRTQSPSKARRNAPRENTPVVSFSAHTPTPAEDAVDPSSAFYRPRRARSHGPPNSHEGPWRDSQPRGGGGGGGGPPRGGRGGRVYTQTYNSRKQTAGRGQSEDFGPPPDPAYNYLADRSRDVQSINSQQIDKPPRFSQDGGSGGGGGGGGGRGGKDPRRHPRNFGGSDFSNVKTQMKAVKEKERDRRSYPPRNRLEMSVNMTGTERIQYEDWKAERQKVDQERLDRQKTSSGEWRRAWDQEKHYKEYEETHSSGRTEPVKRPVGRIGSGRFDRGDRDDRRAEGLSQSPKAPGQMQSIQPLPENNDRKPPAGRGRGRGRGRARTHQPGGPGEKPPRPRTWSGGDDARTVECSNDMLVVKIDKSRGCDDHSVEVEYGPDEEVEKRKSSPPKRKPGRRSPTKQKQQQQQPQSQFQDADVPHSKGTSSIPSLASMSSQDSSIYEGRPASLSQSISVGSTDEWEDITGTDSDMYANTTEDEGELYRRGSGRLNPEAPVFLPTSPDLQAPSSGSRFSLPPKEQRRNRSSASPRVSECSPGTSSCDESNPTPLPEPNPSQQQTSQEDKQITIDDKGLDLVEEEDISEDTMNEKENLDAYEDAELDYEDDEEEFFDPEKEEEEKDAHFNSSSEVESPRDLPAGSDELSTALQSEDGQEDVGSPPDSGASLADELCAAGETQHSGTSLATHASVQEEFSSPELNEIEEDDMEEDIVPHVMDDTVPQGEALPDMATALENRKEEQEASVDADSSCQAAPDNSANGSPRDNDKQMASTVEDDDSREELEGSSSSQLISSSCKAGKETAESNVMEQPDIQHVNGLAADEAADTEPDDGVAMGSPSSTSLSA